VVSPCSDRISRAPPYSRTIIVSTRTGLSPTTANLSRLFHFNYYCHWPGPRSLATTCGVSVDVLSCRYLDVSVPCVRFLHPILFRCRYLITMLGNHSGCHVLTAKGLRTTRRTTGDALSRCIGSSHTGQRPSAIARRKRLIKDQTARMISQAFKVGFPIRISMDQSLFAAPHGFSQRITSFIACACQGIHQMPLNHLIVLIANAHHLCWIWNSYPSRLRSKGFQI
jgi:hypothetical protein